MGTEKGVKLDAGKNRLDLIPVEAIEAIGNVLTFGAEKYTPEGWKTVPDAENRYYAALLRHLFAYRRGEITDPESGLPHLHHVICNAAFLIWLEDNELPKTEPSL